MNYTGYPSWFDDTEKTSCYNCNNPCPGAFLIARGVNYE